MGEVDKQECESVERMWDAYLAAMGDEGEIAEKGYDAWHFCNDEEGANNLLELVLKGKKRGTCSVYCLYEMDGEEMPKAGEYSVITNWQGEAGCVIQTTKVELVAYKDVGDAFARKEGEGDLSLAYWRRVHWECFTEELAEHELVFSEEMLLVCEEFEVAYQ